MRPYVVRHAPEIPENILENNYKKFILIFGFYPLIPISTQQRRVLILGFIVVMSNPLNLRSHKHEISSFA